jgi:hypothetical protein
LDSGSAAIKAVAATGKQYAVLVVAERDVELVKALGTDAQASASGCP